MLCAIDRLLLSEQGKESGNADEMGFNNTDDGVAVPNTTTISTTATLAAPIPWYDLNSKYYLPFLVAFISSVRKCNFLLCTLKKKVLLGS